MQKCVILINSLNNIEKLLHFCKKKILIVNKYFFRQIKTLQQSYSKFFSTKNVLLTLKQSFKLIHTTNIPISHIVGIPTLRL